MSFRESYEKVIDELYRMQGRYFWVDTYDVPVIKKWTAHWRVIWEKEKAEFYREWHTESLTRKRPHRCHSPELPLEIPKLVRQ